MDKVGPGHYEMKGSLGPKGPKWHPPPIKEGVSKQNAGKSATATQEEVGPGYYDVNKHFVPMYKYNMSSNFASRVPKSPPMRKTVGAKMNPQQTKTEFTESEEEETDSEEDETPGPGYYYNPRAYTSFRPRFVPENLQFFGSTSDRFVKRKIEQNIGPGQYTDLGTNFGGENKKLRAKTSIPFASSDKRFGLENNPKLPGGEVPGPGTYGSKGIKDQILGKVWGKNGAFGTTEKRFAKFSTPVIIISIYIYIYKYIWDLESARARTVQFRASVKTDGREEEYEYSKIFLNVPIQDHQKRHPQIRR